MTRLDEWEFELDAEGYVVQYQYNRHFEKSRKKVYVNNQALKAALEVVRREDAALDDGAAIRLALSRLSSPDALSAQLTEQLDTLNTQQARIERMTHALDQVSSEIAQTHADNGVLGDKLHAAAQRLQGLSQQASLEAARQSELAQRITGLQDDIRQEEQALIGQYQAEVTLAHTKVQEAKNALKAKPNDAVLKQALAMATKDEQAAKARLSTIESQISAHPFGDEAKAEAVNITPQTPSVGAFNPNPHRDDVKASAGLDDVDALSEQAEQRIDEASNKQSQAEQSVAANQAKVSALRAELETLSAGMQAQFDALNAQREAYDALQVSLAEHTTEVKARQRNLDSAWQSLSGKQAAENTASAALRTQQAQAQQWQAKLDAAKASVADKSGRLTNLSLNRLNRSSTALVSRSSKTETHCKNTSSDGGSAIKLASAANRAATGEAPYRSWQSS